MTPASFIRNLNWKLTALMTVLMLASLMGLTIFFNGVFRPLIEPELARKAEVVGHYVIAQFDRAIDLNISVNQLVGVDELLDDTIANNRDIRALTLTDPAGIILYQSTDGAHDNTKAPAPPQSGPQHFDPGALLDTAVPLQRGGQSLAILHVGMDPNHIQAALTDIIYDLGSILLVAILLNFEILLLVIGTGVLAPIQEIVGAIRHVGSGALGARLRARDSSELAMIGRAINGILDTLAQRYRRHAGTGNGPVPAALAQLGTALATTTVPNDNTRSLRGIVGLRFAIFIFSLAEELTRTFLSVYIKDMFEPVPGLPAEIVIGAPIALFMLTWAIVQPIAGSVSEHRGRRGVFLTGALLSALGLAACGLVGDLLWLTVARCVTAIGYASVFMAAQGFVIDNTDPRDRAQSMALYAGGILTAGVSGPAIGGILANEIGFTATFLASAGLALLTALIGWRLIQPQARTARPHPPSQIKSMLQIARNPRFIAVALFSGAPTKMGLTALLFFLLPLSLNDQGVSQATIGRVLLLYWLLMLLLSPVAARLSDRWGQRLGFLALGATLAATAAVLLSRHDMMAMAAGVALLGLAHALVGSPQLALLSEVCRPEARKYGETTVIGLFRLIERLGSVIAPFVAGLFLAHYGYSGALQGIGGLLGFCLVPLFFFYFAVHLLRQRRLKRNTA
ncbi:MAG: MFS transporter [Azospirillaceae bacterium]|nr:MFS transporter [Azospirillaceae bacterium]